MTKKESAERAISTLMDALASVLMRIDITPARVDELTRNSFVKAGAGIAQKKRSGRPHIARVAALTGLTRTEVQKIVRANYRIGDVRLDQLPRALRVAFAWSTLPKYKRGGRPIALRLRGRQPSFETLCKEHSGDIPYRAMITELESRGLVALNQRRAETYVSLLAPPKARDSGIAETLTYAAELMSAIADDERVIVKKAQYVPNPQNLAPAYFENSLATRVSTLIEQLPIDSGSRRRVTRRSGLEVFAVVSRTKKIGK